MTVELRAIHKRFGPVHANNNITLTLARGHIYGILGENGAGKSTLMKILSGFYRADSGEIRIDDRPARYDTPLGAIGAGIGMLQQDPLDVGPFSVIENFIYGQPGGVVPDLQAARTRFDQIIQRFAFDLHADAFIDQLSIAQRQQLEIVRLVALGVRVLILDEPTTGISAEQKDILFSALKTLAKEDGVIVLFVSHKLEDVLELCDAVAVLRRGQLVGTADLPVTTEHLVAMMFGQALSPAARDNVPLGKDVLQVEGWQVHAGRLRMHVPEFRIAEGEVVGLAGLDGSGQSLFMRSCVGLVRAHAGSLTLAGQNYTGHAYRDFLAADVAFGAAGRLEEGLVAGLTLTEHFALADPLQRLFINWGLARRLTERQIAHYNVRGRPNSLIEQLSGGNQQRVLMALMPEQPCLLVLEHPTRGLDVESARWIWEQILARRAQGTAILFTSADLDEIVTYSDRILVFHAGQVSEINDLSQLTVDALGHLIGGHGFQDGGDA